MYSPPRTDAKARGYKPNRFSFNVKGGRCEACSGDGIVKIEMHFLSGRIRARATVCGGKRYNRETLEVRYKGKSIYDVLEMTVDEALRVPSRPLPKHRSQTANLARRGPRLCQARPALDDAVRRRGAAHQAGDRAFPQAPTGRTMYILDEPTTGLHIGRRGKADRDSPPAGGCGQHAGGHRTQSGRDQDCGLHSSIIGPGGRRRRRHDRRRAARPRRSPNAKRALPAHI